MNQNGYIHHNYSSSYLVKLYLYTEAFIKVGHFIWVAQSFL